MMISDAILRSLPLGFFGPMRHAAARLGRRNPVRLACLPVLRLAARANGGSVGSRLSEIRPLDDVSISFEPGDSMVAEAVYWYGIRGYEGTVARTWIDLVSRSRSVLEIGGNIGFFPVIGGRHAVGAYDVLEPVPRNARMLRANLVRNGLGDRVVVHEAAAIPGSVEQAVMLNVPSEGRGQPVGAHLTIGSEVNERTSEEVVSVRGLPMAELIVGRDLVKIDAEGVEFALLGCVRDHLLTHTPTLVIEVLPESSKLGLFLRDIAQDAGYDMYALPEYGRDDIVRLDPATFDSRVPGTHNAKDVVLTKLAI